MLVRMLVVPAALGVLAGCAAQGAPGAGAPSPAASSRPLVLEAYPDATAVGEPGWLLSGGAHDAYHVQRDATASPTAWLLEPIADTFGRYGTWMRQVDAAAYRGKRVRISGQIKTKGATRRVDFWARVQAADSPGDGPGLGGQLVALPADSEFEAKAIVLDVPDEAAQIEYGVGVAGPGRVWLDAAKIETVGSDVPVTTGYPGEAKVADWLLTGVGAPDYALVADGDAVRVEAKSGTSPRYVAVIHVVPAAEYVGKHVSLSFEVRTDGVDRGACVVKAQRTPSLQYAGFLAADMSEVKTPQAAFAPCATGIDVPPGAKWILYGFSYRGAGKAWMRGGRVEAR